MKMNRIGLALGALLLCGVAWNAPAAAGCPGQTGTPGSFQSYDNHGGGCMSDNGNPISAATIPSGGAGLTGWLSAIWYQLTQTITTSPAATTSQALAYASVTAGTPVTVLGASAPNAHGKGGSIINCNATGTMYVNDQATATQTEGGSNVAIAPGIGGYAGSYTVPPGTQQISVNFSNGTGSICGEGLN